MFWIRPICSVSKMISKSIHVSSEWVPPWEAKFSLGVWSECLQALPGTSLLDSKIINLIPSSIYPESLPWITSFPFWQSQAYFKLNWAHVLPSQWNHLTVLTMKTSLPYSFSKLILNFLSISNSLIIKNASLDFLNYIYFLQNAVFLNTETMTLSSNMPKWLPQGILWKLSRCLFFW